MPISWKDIECFFPDWKVAELRQEMCQKYKQGIQKKELMKDYLISESALNEILNRYEEAQDIRDYFNKSKNPKKPSRKYSDEDYDHLEKIACDEQARVEKAAQSWKSANQASPKPVSKKKEDRQANTITSKAKRGVRKLANQFNREPEIKSAGKNISHSQVYNILTDRGLTPKGQKTDTNTKKKEKKQTTSTEYPIKGISDGYCTTGNCRLYGRFPNCNY